MRRLENSWYGNSMADHVLSLALWPLSLLFRIVAALRRYAYRCGLLSAAKLPVPVVIVGNIPVGGTGKTPLTIALATALRNAGKHPGIITRGYGGSRREAHAVGIISDARDSGDEAILLTRLSGCPVWAGANRVAAARALLADNPGCDILLSDDGLQHYALARDFEIAVIDGARGLGNGRLLPAGPLRETAARLNHVNAVVLNGDGPAPSSTAPVYRMHLRGDRLRNLKTPQQTVDAEYFRGRKVHAVAAIGHPQRFFDHLRGLCIVFQAHAFPDHYAFTAQDLAFGDDAEIIMTGKDAVKCFAFAGPHYWQLPVEAVLDGDLTGQILHQIGKPR